MVNTTLSLQKLIKIIAEVWFYSMGIMLLFLFIFNPVNPIAFQDIIKACIPIGYGNYWFATDYILLMLMSPILNLVISEISQKFHRNIIILSIVMWFVIPSFTLAYYDCSKLCCFIVLYFIAGYIRKYVTMTSDNSLRHFALAIFSYCLVIFSNILLIYLGYNMKFEKFVNQSGHFAALNSPFVLLASVELLVGFLKMRPYRNSYINYIASATFGVYLIHEHPFFRPYLWQVILKNQKMYSSDFLIVHALCSIIGVFIICSLLDLLRQATVEKILMMFMHRYYIKIKKNIIGVLQSMGDIVKKMIVWYYDKQG